MVPVPLVLDDVLLVVRVPVVELPRVLVPRVLVAWVLLLHVLAWVMLSHVLASCNEMVVKRRLLEVVLGSISRSFILSGVAGLVPVGVLVVVPVLVVPGRRDEESSPAGFCVELVCSGPLTRTK